MDDVISDTIELLQSTGIWDIGDTKQNIEKQMNWFSGIPSL